MRRPEVGFALWCVIASILIAGVFTLILRLNHFANKQDEAWQVVKIKWEDARLVRVCPNSTFIYRLKDGEFWTGDRSGYRDWSRQTELKVC